jgi:hypothetical protein
LMSLTKSSDVRKVFDESGNIFRRLKSYWLVWQYLRTLERFLMSLIISSDVRKVFMSLTISWFWNVTLH